MPLPRKKLSEIGDAELKRAVTRAVRLSGTSTLTDEDLEYIRDLGRSSAKKLLPQNQFMYSEDFRVATIDRNCTDLVRMVQAFTGGWSWERETLSTKKVLYDIAARVDELIKMRGDDLCAALKKYDLPIDEGCGTSIAKLIIAEFSDPITDALDEDREDH